MVVVSLGMPSTGMAQAVSLDGTCPSDVNISITGATPGGQVVFLKADSTGTDGVTPPSAGPCAGISTGLEASTQRLLGVVSTATGNLRQNNQSINASLCGGAVVIMDVSTCGVSNVSLMPHTGTEFNPAYCNQVDGTLDIHWEGLAGITPCSGIEFTDGVLADAVQNRAIVMSGTSVSDSACVGLAEYDLTVSPDQLTLSGFDTAANVPMVLTRSPGETCFVGHWLDSPYDYRAHISVSAFGISAW
jgi:hypothetical protein